jgi:PAS domain S-box-containing protein
MNFHRDSNQGVEDIHSVGGGTTVSGQDQSSTEPTLHELRVLSSIGKSVISGHSIEHIILSLNKRIGELFDLSLFAIGVYNKEYDHLAFWGNKTSDTTIITGYDDLSDPCRWSTHCYREQKEILIRDYDEHSRHYFSKLLFSEEDNRRLSFMYLPLTNHSKKLGVITIQNFKKNAYNEYHLELLRNLSNYLTIALENALAFEQMLRQNEEITEKSEALKVTQDNLERLVELRTRQLSQQKDEIEQKNKQLEMLSIVAEQTDNAIMIMNHVGDVLWINKSFTRLYGYTYNEFISIRGSNIRQTSFSGDIRKLLEDCILHKKVVYYEAPNVTIEGRTIWTQTSLTPILDEEKRITYLATIDTDITRRKEYEIKILKQSKAITQSIQYAFQIQQALLPQNIQFEKAFKDHFILYRPKAIVSGDFYWLREYDHKTVLALADCTGHGVPGAFMSLLGITYLNEIVNSLDNLNAADILNLLRNKVINALNPEGKCRKSDDGMDITLCIFDKETRTLEFSSAFHSILMCNAEGASLYKGNRMPIGQHPRKEVPFDLQAIRYSEGDIVYLYSDGFKDQLGGKEGVKFMSHNFKNLLMALHKEPFVKQHEILSETMEAWKGRYEQTDDITMIGISLK